MSAQLLKAHKILARFGSLADLANEPLEALLSIKGLGDLKILRIAARPRGRPPFTYTLQFHRGLACAVLQLSDTR
ncbi:MAG: hypothetical protein DMG24_19790 [Acidobacteria bacterium]|nr:MAG: hypothetical protein DMG24_19790 [Acidobacteriota bacterium]